MVWIYRKWVGKWKNCTVALSLCCPWIVKQPSKQPGWMWKMQKIKPDMGKLTMDEIFGVSVQTWLTQHGIKFLLWHAAIPRVQKVKAGTFDVWTHWAEIKFRLSWVQRAEVSDETKLFRGKIRAWWVFSFFLLRFCDGQPPEQTHVRLHPKPTRPVLPPPGLSLRLLQPHHLRCVPPQWNAGRQGGFPGKKDAFQLWILWRCLQSGTKSGLLDCGLDMIRAEREKTLQCNRRLLRLQPAEL